MRLTNGIALFNKQAHKVNKISKHDILEKNGNFSVPVIDQTTNKNQKKKLIDKKDKEKVTLIKSFCNKNERKSRSKSNSSNKEYKKRNKSSNITNNIQRIIINNNTSYSQNLIYQDKNKYIFSPYILTPILGMKIYENVNNKIFEYIKNAVPKKLFIDIKKMFIKYTLEELHVKNNILMKKSDAEIVNINLKLFYNKGIKESRSNSKKKKNQTQSQVFNQNLSQNDFSFTRNHNNKTLNKRNYNNNFSKQDIFNGLLDNHSSLYSLSKKCTKIKGAPFTFKVTKSPKKTRSKSGSKERTIINKNKIQNYYSNNIFDPDLHVFKLINQKQRNNGTNLVNINKRNKLVKKINNNLLLSKKNRTNNIVKSLMSNTIIYSEKKKGNLQSNKTLKKKENNKEQEQMEKKNEENKNQNNKNDEQLKQIKSGLDDNLKLFFNFSYENFLNKESETESKKSIEASSRKDKKEGSINNNKIIDVSYQPKYK
jgi:hypothetical protein